MGDNLTIREFRESEGMAEWPVLSDGACTFFRTGSLAEGARLVAAIGALPGIDDHAPDIDIRHDGVTVRLVTRSADWYGMTQRDIEVARQVLAVAGAQGLTADASAVQSFLVVPGAPDITAVMPFWRAVLGYEPRPDSPAEDLVDPHDRWPGFWFEQMEEPRADGGGAIHVAVWLPFDQAEARVKAALAAGGRIVRDDFAPAWWTLADAAGNECDVATSMHRD
jgi:4a-hydroxytetrahydrobiopterin dehydratase